MTDRAYWNRVKALFHAALERLPRERDAFLQQACGDDRAILQDVETLLTADAEAGSFAQGTAIAALDPSTAQAVADALESGGRVLMIGDRLGPYEILASIGAGGMGEVYRARDTRLDRLVAIKILPSHLMLSSQFRARFEREAKAIAALTHPCICALHDIGHQNGTDYLVLEYIEGETLASRIAREPLSVEDAARIAIQIAEALHAAHDKGIVHRDLKPANIRITNSGGVKVLDFGLAKILPTHPSRDEVHTPPIATVSGTREGTIVGTSAYMSPEQARGLAVDKRTDIWAFGCVLYEMLAGQPAFGGDTSSDTIAMILERDPDWHHLPENAPTPVRQLLRRSLEKDRERRLADISDARFDLEEALTSPASNDPRATTQVSRGGMWRFVTPLIVGLIVGGVITALVLRRTTRESASRVSRLTMTLLGRAALNVNGSDHDLALSPDGSRLVYVGAKGSQLFVRAMNELNEAAITDVGAPRNPFFSPDGEWVGFFDGDTLKKVAITGGSAVTICRIPAGELGPRGAAWGPDGTIVFATISHASGLFAVSAAGGQPALLTTPDPKRGEANHWWPEFLPGGQAVLFTIANTAGQRATSFSVAVVDRRTGTQKILVREGSDAHYLPSGHLVYAAAGSLRAAAFDLDRLEVRGVPVPVLDQVLTAVYGSADFAVARDGTLIYIPGVRALDRTLVWVDRQGHEEPIPVPAAAYTVPRLSPDGSRLALDVRGQENRIWIWDFARQTPTRFSINRDGESYPVWTADGQRLVFSSDRPPPPGLFWQAADGTGVPERLGTTRDFVFLSAVSHDDSWVVFTERDELMALSLRGDRQVRPLVQTPYSAINGDLSPDGRWLAYQSNESGQYEIYVRPFPDVNAGRWKVSADGGARPLWSRNGAELFYLAGARYPGPSGALMSVRVNRGTTWSADPPTKLFEGDYLAPVLGRTYDASANSQRFVMIKATDEAAHPSVIVVENWSEELKQRAPTK